MDLVARPKKLSAARLEPLPYVIAPEPCEGDAKTDIDQRLRNMRYNLEASSRIIMSLRSEAEVKDAKVASLSQELTRVRRTLAERDAQLACLEGKQVGNLRDAAYLQEEKEAEIAKIRADLVRDFATDGEHVRQLVSKGDLWRGCRMTSAPRTLGRG